MHSTAQSESGKLKKLYIKPAAHAFLSDDHMAEHWHVLNYLGKPDMTEALKEYADFEAILKAHGAEVLHFPEDEAVNMDSIYCRDASIATDGGVILCNMGKEGRKAEPGAKRKAYEAMGSRSWARSRPRERWRAAMWPGWMRRPLPSDIPIVPTRKASGN